MQGCELVVLAESPEAPTRQQQFDKRFGQSSREPEHLANRRGIGPKAPPNR